MLKRRDFLRATLITAGAMLVPGCGSDEQPTPKRDLTQDPAYFPQSVASGDPKEGSVILWTRVVDPGEEGDFELELEVSKTEAFDELVSLDGGQAKVQALAKYDNCVKVKVTGLEPATVYYYRFIYVKGEKNYATRVGRTKTAPRADADVTVKFAYASCQDFIGRFYNPYILMAEEDLDFVVHLGDYVYETTGDPTFQATNGRVVTFSDEAGAIALGAGDKTYYAAKSLSNYRELYKTYRSDANLQAIHEKFPMIATWDDHEFSDDSHGATASYFDDKQDETDVDRRKAANQAWFEYQPVDYSREYFEYDPEANFPGDIQIYRQFVFGRNVHLLMTDLRSYRADHVIPEGAFPGTVVADQAAVTAEFGSVPEIASPYVDVEAYQGGTYKQVLVGAAATAGYDPAKVTGKISVAFINGVVEKVNMTNPPQPIPLIDATDPTLERGLSYLDVGKTSFNSSIGSRYFVIADAFDAISSIGYKASEKASENVMGADQEQWFLDTMKSSTATWKVWGNEYCLTQLAIDLTGLGLPAAFSRRFYMNVDDWNGFRNKRSELISELAGLGGVVAITGDIHAFYASTPTVNGDPTKKIVEFVGSGITSTPFRSLLQKQVAADPVLSSVPGAGELAGNIDALFTAKGANPYLGYAKSDKNGYVTVQASAKEFVVTMTTFGELVGSDDYTGKKEELLPFVNKVKFRALPSDSELYQEIEGAWKKWDPTTQAWV